MLSYAFTVEFKVIILIRYTRGVQYVIKIAQCIPKFYIYTLRIYFHLKVRFLAK